MALFKLYFFSLHKSDHTKRQTVPSQLLLAKRLRDKIQGKKNDKLTKYSIKYYA